VIGIAFSLITIRVHTAFKEGTTQGDGGGGEGGEPPSTRTELSEPSAWRGTSFGGRTGTGGGILTRSWLRSSEQEQLDMDMGMGIDLEKDLGSKGRDSRDRVTVSIPPPPPTATTRRRGGSGGVLEESPVMAKTETAVDSHV